MQASKGRKPMGVDWKVYVGPAKPNEAAPVAVMWRAADTNPNGPAKVNVDGTVE